MFVGVARAEVIRAYHYSLISFTSIAEQQERMVPNQGLQDYIDVETSSLGGGKGSQILFVDAPFAIEKSRRRISNQ
jgi:hypothetical protein